MRKHHKYIDLNTLCIAFIFIFYSRIHSITFSIASQMLAGVVVVFFFSPNFFSKTIFFIIVSIYSHLLQKIIKMLTLWLVRGLEGFLASFSCNSYPPPPPKIFFEKKIFSFFFNMSTCLKKYVKIVYLLLFREIWLAVGLEIKQQIHF